MLPELPARDYEWRHSVRRTSSRTSCSVGSRSAPRRRLAKVAEYVVVGVIDAVLILALVHPALTRLIFESALSSPPSTISARQ
jgi:hypothetical protein